MSQVYSKKISFDVVSKGRKYFKIRYSPEHNEFQLVINDLTRHFRGGDRVEDLLCEFSTQVNSYSGGRKTTATAVDLIESAARMARAKESERETEIARWRGYVESALGEGRIYAKGFSKLAELGFDNSFFAARIEEIREANRKTEVARWSGYCEEAAIDGRDYARGLSKLAELGAPEVAQKFREHAATVRSAQKTQVETSPAESGIVSYWFGSPPWSGPDLTHLRVGDVYQDQGVFYKILTCRNRYVHEDGLSFGLADDNGEITQGTARIATTEEAAPLVAEEKAIAEKKAAKSEFAAKRKALADLIVATGDRPEHTSGELLLSTVTHYGGGDWFEISSSEIWYCQNNGSDGSDWSLNNVRTWGAGAIGVRIPYDAAIAERIYKLIELQSKWD